MANGKIIRQLTTSNFDFTALARSKESKYVDKTDLLYELARNRDESQYFISRPRRFGKSLMLSTLQAMFEGRKSLFKGLAIYDKPWEGWTAKKRHPVYNFSMMRANGATVDKFLAALENLVRDLCEEAGVPYKDKVDATVNFGEFLKAAAAKSPTKKIVVLIDEYDEPVAGFLDDLESLKLVRKTLHDFYEKLKDNSKSIRFLMMTGVTKLTKLSVFSGLNHLTDLSMDKRFATLLGFTPEELDGELRENVEEFGEKNGLDFATAKAKLLEWYDGYRFAPGSEAKVCNPVSIGKAFASGDLLNYWESTGGATLVIERLKQCGKTLYDFEDLIVSQTQLDVCDAETLPVEALLYQSGYLTLKETFDETTYSLGIPNNEVRDSLTKGYVGSLMGAAFASWNDRAQRARLELRAKGVDTLLSKNLRAAFAAVPHDWRIESEAEAKRYFLLYLRLVGADISGEVQSANGRADAILKDKTGVYVFEFKYGRSAKEALDQARTKDYAGPWLDAKPPVFLVGVNYDPAKRGIDDPLVEPL